MKFETLALLEKVAENVLDIVMREHPEIITEAIIKTMNYYVVTGCKK